MEHLLCLLLNMVEEFLRISYLSLICKEKILKEKDLDRCSIT